MKGKMGMCKRVKVDDEPMALEHIVYQLRRFGDTFPQTLDNDQRACTIRDVLYKFADTIELHDKAERSAAVKLFEANKLLDENMRALVEQRGVIAQQQGIIRGAYAERDELKRQLDAMKGGAV